MKRAPVLITLLLAAFAVNLDTTLVNVALPDLSRQLGASTSALQWVVDAYNLVFAAFLLGAGSLSDRLGHRRMLVTGLTVLGTASLVGAAATGSGQLIAARAVMGLGSALAFPATLSLILDVFPERDQRARAIGLWGAVAGVAIAVGPIVGGWLLSEFTWPSIFLAMVPVAYVAVGCALAFLPGTRGDAGAPLDLVGLATSVLAMAALVFTIIQAPSYGWVSGRTVAGFAFAAILFGVFVDRERRATAPVIDLRIFRNARFSAASAALTVASFTLFGFIFLTTQYFQFVRGYTALGAGLRLLPFAASVAAGSVVGTGLAVRAGNKLVVTGGLLLSGAFYAWVAATTSTGLSYGVISLQMIVGGLGMGFTSAPATESIMTAITSRAAGVGSAVNDATRLVGGTLGVAVIGSVFNSLYQQRVTDRLVHAPLPRTDLGTIRGSTQGGLAVAGHLTHSGSPLGEVVRSVTTNAFLHGLQAGSAVAAGVAAAGALATALALPARPATAEPEADVLTHDPVPQPSA